MTNKPYTWEEIEKLLAKELRKTRHIMTYGTIGSRNIDKDIDTIITKKPNSKSSDFYKEVHELFDKLNEYLNKTHKCKLIVTRRFDSEIEICKLGGKQKNDLVLQVMTYISRSQIKMHWLPNTMLEGQTAEKIIREDYECIYGEFGDVLSEEFEGTVASEGLFLYVNDLDRINSNYDEKLLCEVMNSLFDFILRKRLKLEPKIAKNKKEVREIFYHTCDELDKRNSA